LLPFVLLPAIQNRHPELEFNDEYVPCGHNWHDDQFIKEKNPGPQSTQTDAFEAPWNLPGEQLVQFTLAICGAYFPVRQPMHAVLSASEYFPGGHTRQPEEPAIPLIFPAGQSWHWKLVAPAAVRYFPSKHEMQTVDPFVSWYVPAPHSKQPLEFPNEPLEQRLHEAAASPEKLPTSHGLQPTPPDMFW
jgi:hypothetical protein